MSKENAIRFMMVKDKDEAIKNAFDAIMGKYQGKILSKNDQDKVLKEEIIPLAKQYGYEFTLEDFAELQTEGKLSDEELGQITGGRGEYSDSHTLNSPFGPIPVTTVFSCDYASDNETFRTRCKYGDTNCPDFEYNGNGDRRKICYNCAHLHLS